MSAPAEEARAVRLRGDFLRTMHTLGCYWAGEHERGRVKDVRTACLGVVHSVLCALDGVSGELPAFDVTSDGVPIHGTNGHVVMLHEEWVKYR